MLTKLPIGIQDFRTIITEDYKYVDKTSYIHRLATSGKFYFLSRPRRFGKSITIATLQELYSGSRELFKGLWIEDKWDWEKKHPIIRLNLSGMGTPELGVVAALNHKLDTMIEAKGFNPLAGAPANKLEYLITKLAVINKVVVLIDEYDAPIIHYLGKDLEKALASRETLKEFYTVLKTNDHLLELVFLTGVSKFSKVGIFSGLNNIQDLTNHPSYATMLGYTQEELESNFSEEIDKAANTQQLSREALLEKLKFWYNGYRFEENAPTVYNPVSINTFFSFQKFENFWFSTGTPTFLITILREERLYNFSLEPQTQIEFDGFELDDLRPYGLLYQTGYLTIDHKDEYGLYHLRYPNYEVEHSMLAYLLEAFGGVRKGEGLGMAIKMEKAFMAGDVDRVLRILQTMFKGLPYQLYDKTPERFYHAAIHLLFSYMGLRVQSEVCTSDGRADCVVETEDSIYILEFKLDESAAVALEQIRRKQYYQAWWEKGKTVVGVGINFSSETRNIEEWGVEEIE